MQVSCQSGLVHPGVKLVRNPNFNRWENLIMCCSMHYQAINKTPTTCPIARWLLHNQRPAACHCASIACRIRVGSHNPGANNRR